MKDLHIKAYAKINLSLDVISKREDGYHNLNMIMQQIDIYDELTLIESNDIIVECDNIKIPTDSRNLVYKAWKAITTKYSLEKGVRIIINKNIPVAAGLAGGSSDAAAVLKGLNKLWQLGISDQELMNIGIEIGADVPYCISGGTMQAEGIGEKLTKLDSYKGKLVLIAKPDIDVSTAYVYGNLDLDKAQSNHPNIEKIKEYIRVNDIKSLSKHMGNTLESVTICKYPEINAIKQKMVEYGALGSLMSGSGPTVFGLFDNEKDLDNCYHKLKNTVKYVAKTVTI
ncbi:4-(cytidine 5'-diphospho)-2-C-methyl-D-erythritol kinase [Clostridiaceae bacterium M8S5]|nr:4-(cytidine 5'-diphospho)-2-C-methyl-D-erythritol kinase [Clostridiaceae bacterium M8S5]